PSASPLFPYATLFRSVGLCKILDRPPAEFHTRMCFACGMDESFHWFQPGDVMSQTGQLTGPASCPGPDVQDRAGHGLGPRFNDRSEEHTSELQSRFDL